MTDPHLNLFYSYNRDNELIENNLTRAWIVTLRLLSAETRNALLSQLIHEPLTILLDDKNAELPSFNNAQVALQTNIDRKQLKNLSQKQKYLLAITSFDIDSVGESQIVYDSYPDAWIYDFVEDGGYVFLIEAKIGGNVLDISQMTSHARTWLSIDQLSHHLITISWYDILSAIDEIKQMAIDELFFLNQQEFLLLESLVEYLKFFDYRLFSGFNFSLLLEAPRFSLSLFQLMNVLQLFDPPRFRIGH